MSVLRQRTSRPPSPRAAPAELVRVRVWDLPVRAVHWLLVAALAVLSVTGFLIGDPDLAPSNTVDWVTWIKTIHEFTAYVFIALLIARVMWLFTSPNRWSRWTQWLPVSRARRAQILPSLRFYLFLQREPPDMVGHNPLAGMTYTLLYLMFGLEVFTGLVLWGVQGEAWAATLTGWSLTLVPLPVIRFIHHLIMWLTWGFMAHHVYSAWLVDRLEGSGLLSSIFSGFKFLPKDRLPPPDRVLPKRRIPPKDWR